MITILSGIFVLVIFNLGVDQACDPAIIAIQSRLPGSICFNEFDVVDYQCVHGQDSLAVEYTAIRHTLELRSHSPEMIPNDFPRRVCAQRLCLSGYKRERVLSHWILIPWKRCHLQRLYEFY